MGYTLRYYDVILVAILGSLVVGLGIGYLTPIPLYLAVFALAILGVLLIGHALFVRGPVEDVGDLTEEVEPEELPGSESLTAWTK